MSKNRKHPSVDTPTTAPVVAIPQELWEHTPDDHDYPAAESYLSLCTSTKQAAALVALLRDAPIELHKAKDLLRATGLPLLSLEDPSVQRDLAKVITGTRLSPVLVVRGDIRAGVHATIADGYHRMCASYHLSENESIPCRIIDLPVAKHDSARA